MKKAEEQAIEILGKSVDLSEREQAKKEEANRPFTIIHGTAEQEFEVPIKKLISSKILDKATKLIKEFEPNVFIKFRDSELIPAGLISVEKFKAKKANKDLDDSELNNKYLQEIYNFAKKIYKDEKFSESATYSESELMAKFGGKYSTDRPQIKEVKRLNIEIIKLIIDTHKLNTDENHKGLKHMNGTKELLSDHTSDFWQNQDEKEVARIADKFRSEYF